MIANILKLGVLLTLMKFSTHCIAEDTTPTTESTRPILNEVTLMFGENLNEAQGLEKDLLLAIGVDHTSSNTPDVVKGIGIPFILEHGPRYWIHELESGNKDITVLMNNALILIYAKDSNEDTKRAALTLMKMAADKNYWPAKYYLAEHNLENYLSSDYGHDVKDMTINDQVISKIASITMEYYKDCARRGFAPCQYRLGTWLLAREETASNGLQLLDSAIHISINDTRYKDNFENRRANAAVIIVSVGKQYGYSEEQINTYADLINQERGEAVLQ